MTMFPDLHSTQRLRQTYGVVLALTLAFRFWLAAVMPITGDEAYFIIWGKVPDWGYYDHPPMVGWWLAALLRVSEAPWWLRLPSVVQPAIVSLMSVWALRREGPLAWLTAIFILLAPASVLNVLITTDTPLIYFSFLSGLAFLSAVRIHSSGDTRQSAGLYLLAGAMLGCAFTSKYFAVLLGLAYWVYALIRPTAGKLLGLALVVFAALPFVAFNLWWNWDHCWANVMFNLYNRHEKAGLSWKTPLLYAVSLLYLLSPHALMILARQRSQLAQMWRTAEFRALMLIALAPLAVFAALSLVKTIGLHWLLSFVPFVLILVVHIGEVMRLRRLLYFMIGFAALHAVATVVIYNLPIEIYKNTRFYDGLVMTVKSQELLAVLEPYASDYVFATEGYSPSVTLSFNARRYFIVFGEASSHARHDDILTDFRALDGRNILVLRKSEARREDYDPYFHEVEYKTFQVRGASFHLVLGRGFDYPAYRAAVLAKVRDKYYAIPSYLPQGRCYFCERYFPQMQCGM